MNRHRNAMNGMAGATLAAALLLVGTLPVGVAAQDDADARWLPWLGCWEAIGEVEEESLLCIRPTGNGVEMLTMVEDKEASRVTVVADGIDRATTREGCEGNERAEFSDDGQRVYLHASYLCEGGTARQTSGLMSMNTPYEWMDVRAAAVSGREVAWARRYRLASPKKTEAAGFADVTADRAMAVSAARMAASAEIEIEDVIDATAHVSPKAVEAWVAERGERFDLNADVLVMMDDAGVPGSVVDVVVAVSYPQRFNIGRAGEAGSMMAEEEYVDEYDRRAAHPYYDPFYFDPFYYRGLYSPFGLGYSRYGLYGGYYGYGGWGYGGYYGYGYTPIVVTVTPRDTGSHGRVVKGRGYTRGSSSGTSYPTATGRSSTGSSSGAAASSSAGRSSGSASSGRTSSGRTAKRRGG